MDRVDLFLGKPRPPVKMLGGIISPIQPTQMGCRIDFDSIISISDAFISNEFDRHNPLIGFTIKFKSDLPGVDGSNLEFRWEIPDEPVEVSWEKYVQHYPHRKGTNPNEGPHTIWEKYSEKFLPGLQEVVDYYSDLWEKIKTQGGMKS